MSWDIKGKDNTVKATVYALEYNGEWMGESYVSVTIESPTPIAFAIGDYLMYRGERFEINYDPGKIKSAPQFAKGDAFKYENVKFNSLSDELTRCDFLDVVLGDNQLHFTGLPKFSFYGGVRDLANRIQANLNRAYPNQWTVVVSPEYSGSKELNVSVDTQKVWDALSILVNDFETYFTIKGRTITIGAAGVPAGHLFKYGKGNGLYEIEQNAEADQAIVTRLRAYGSTRNLPHRYYNSLTGADGQKLIPDNMAVQYLMLPSFPYTTQDPYIDSTNIVALGIREGTIFFDGSQEGLEEIYPSIEGMTAEQLKAAGVPCNSTGALDVLVSAEQMTDDGVGDINEGETETTATPPTFKVTLKDLGFDINDHLTTEAATLSFKTGMLGGRDFEIVDCKKEGNNYVLELNRVYDDSIKLWFPYKDYNAKGLQQNADNPDKFVLLHIEMPEVYIKAAAQRLLEAATAWLAKNDYSRSVYTPKVDEIFMARQHDEAMASGVSITSLHDTLKEGMLLLFEDGDLNIDASIFIDRLTIKEGDGPVPTYEVVLKEEKTVGRLDKMQNQIDSLAAGGGQGGGYSASQIRSLIDAYGGLRFLSKLKDDRSKGKIASDLGFEIGNYLAGVSGGIFGIDADNGDSFAEVARLFVRGKAYFETLTTIESKTLAGKQYITPGGSIKCTKVEEVKDAQGVLTDYRCYFLAEQDGEKTDTKIIVGDQAISEMFNAKTGTSNKVSNHHYWRLVTAVNNDAYTDDAGNHYGYIDLSASDCEGGSDIPKSGDNIAQLGYRYSDRPERQTAMIFSTVDPDAPSIKMFGGINSYTLSGKAIIAFGQDAVTHKVYFRLGADGAAQYLDYSQDKGLTLAGSLSVNTTIGDKTIDEYFADKAEAATDKYEYLATALPQDTEITGGVMLSTLVSLGYTDASNIRHTLAGMNGGYVPTLGGRTIGSWWGGEMLDLFKADDTRKTLAELIAESGKNNPVAATSLVRLDGSAYWSNGNIGFRADGSGWLGNDLTGIKFDTNGGMTFGSGVTFDVANVSGLQTTLNSIANWQIGLQTLFVPCDANGDEITWQEATQSDGAGGILAKSLKAKVDLWTVGSFAGKGMTPAAGSTGGGGGGSLFGLYTDTTWVSTPAESDALSAVLGKSLHARVSVLEGAGYLTSITKAMVEAVLTGDITTHTHSLLSKPADNRSVATAPNDYNSKFFFTGMKYRSTMGVQGTGDYVNGFGWRGWLDSSGGKAWEVFGDNADLYVRCGSTTTWEAWRKILTAGSTAELTQLFVTSGADGKIVLNNTDTETKYQMISFRQDGTEYGWLGTAGDDVLKWKGYTLLHTNNYASTLDTRYARQAAANNFVHDSNEVTFVPSGYAFPIWLNYRTVGGTNGAISEYRFGNGSGGAYADVRAKSFIVNGGSASQFLKADGSVDGNSYAAGASPGGAAVWLYGKYAVESGFGGQQLPNYFGKNRVGALMMNTTINGNKQFKDFLIMDCYEGSDVGGAVAIGVNRQALGVYIMRSEATRTEWSQSAELIGTHNYASILDNRYINSDGDTMNGALQMNANQIKFGSLLYMSSVSDRLAVWSGVGGAGPLNVGNLLVSNAWADYTKVPANGIYSKGIISSGVATGTAPFAVLSSTMVSNLNADMLDDLHAIDFARSGRVGNVDLNTITTSGIYGTGGSCTNAPLHTEYGQLLVLHGQGDTPIAQLLFSYNTNGLIYTRAGSPTNTGGKGSYGAWKQLAMIDSNVASASKLYNDSAFTAWGQTFFQNGVPRSISGNLIHVGEFRFEAGTAVLHNATTKVYQLWAVNGINLFPTWSVNTAAISVTPNGRVGVNMFSPAYDFDVTGVIHASGEIFSDKAIGGKGTTSSSDIRLKHIIGDFVMSLDDVLKMPLKRFKWRDGPDKDERIGVIAQEALKIVPQVVYLKPDGFYGVDYGALAHAEVKTVAKVVAQLVERLNKLESQLNNRA